MSAEKVDKIIEIVIIVLGMVGLVLNVMTPPVFPDNIYFYFKVVFIVVWGIALIDIGRRQERRKR